MISIPILIVPLCTLYLTHVATRSHSLSPHWPLYVHTSLKEDRTYRLVGKQKGCDDFLNVSNQRDQSILKDAKPSQLVSIIDYLASDLYAFNRAKYAPFIQMAQVNMLHALLRNPPPQRLVEAEHGDPSFERSLPHLQRVYEMLRKSMFLGNTKSADALDSITATFCG